VEDGVKYAIKVVQKDGDEDYLRDGIAADGRITEFPTYAHAVHKADFLRIGMEGGVQSINVVKYPKRAK
jgi:hypothetical protein